ncbi:Flagellar capping protein, partial [Reticulomyxa filosa]
DGSAGGLATTQSASSAMIKVDGISITSDTNTFTDAVQGLTIKALRQSVSAETAKATVDFDRENVNKQMDAFISAYNNAIDMIDQQSLLPSSALYRDPTVSSIKSQMFDALSTTVADAGKFQTVFDIGLALNKDNRLEKKKVVRSLNDALDTNYADVGRLFTNTGALSETFNKMLETYVGSAGVIKQRQDDANLGTCHYGNKVKHYQKEAVKTRLASADPHQIILMLMEGAVDSMKVAMLTMEQRDFENKAKAMSKACSIIDSLRLSLDMEVGGDLSDNLAALYFYMSRRLMEANVANDQSM